MNPADDNRPLLALTMGDITGIGPEIIIKALSDPGLYDLCRPLIVGDLPALAAAGKSAGPTCTSMKRAP